ncbi:5-methyltetrahydrofolate--homocysteinemethyltransferase [Striga asiatica]|uniref:5-methyltetrahydrofolate--homocysteinemethyltransferase n=1 Tax=Striga asiatica TaxID=4170 RepID=A0A5A7PPN8_STRAF|nr:5-methyltetrahydrofolate--homocysteinemethyltransferase [Striga asiatica]
MEEQLLLNLPLGSKEHPSRVDSLDSLKAIMAGGDDMSLEESNCPSLYLYSMQGTSLVSLKQAQSEKYPAFFRFVVDWMMEKPASRVLPSTTGKDRWHSAVLTDVSDWTPYLDQLVPTEQRPPQREILT